jgi:hypothetical protein
MTTLVIILIIALIIIVKFFIDRDKMIQKQVDSHGGMKQKYKFLIEELSQEATPEFCEVTRDHIYFRFVGNPTTINYYITEQFGKVNIEWMLQLGTIGKKQLKWTFLENKPQEEMLVQIGTDLQKEMEQLSNFLI